MTTIPTPQYAIGQQVWVLVTTSKTETFPCPDCKGERTWTATSRVGEQFTIDCPRCARFRTISSIPSLSRRVSTVTVETRTIGSIRIDTAAGNPERVIEYMCRETGVGSGHVYAESHLYATEAEAQTRAVERQAEYQAEIDALPAVMKSADFGVRPLEAALNLERRTAYWDSWRKAKDLRTAIEAVLEDQHLTDEARETLLDALEDRPWQPPHVVDDLLAALHLVAQRLHAERNHTWSLENCPAPQCEEHLAAIAKATKGQP